MKNTELRLHSDKEIDQFKGKVSTLMEGHKKVVNIYRGRDIFALARTIEAIKNCEPEYKKFGFPVNYLRFAVNDLAAALKGIEAHPIVQYQKDIEEIITSWQVSQKDQSHPPKVA